MHDPEGAHDSKSCCMQANREAPSLQFTSARDDVLRITTTAAIGAVLGMQVKCQFWGAWHLRSAHLSQSARLQNQRVERMAGHKAHLHEARCQLVTLKIMLVTGCPPHHACSDSLAQWGASHTTSARLNFQVPSYLFCAAVAQHTPDTLLPVLPCSCPAHS